MSLAAKLTPHAPKALAALRIMTALLFLQHGLGKFFHFPDVPMFQGLNLFSGQIFSLFGAAGVLEVVGSVLLLIGLCTRPVAFVLSGFMAVAYFMMHAPASFYPILNQGELAIEFAFVFLYFVFAGAGAWSIDAKRGA
ncbi:MAG: DoxX family protein [Phyllobacteriaceae bacterium]|nr:DoxX family protein [Phyllobacteriaceae bacterium]